MAACYENEREVRALRHAQGDKTSMTCDNERAGYAARNVNSTCTAS